MDDFFSRHYKLIGKLVVPCRTAKDVAEAFTSERHVALTHIELITVSTVFLVIDHSWGHGPPLVFETAIVSDYESREDSQYQIAGRCSSWEEAEVMHARAVEKAHEMIAEINRRTTIAPQSRD